MAFPDVKNVIAFDRFMVPPPSLENLLTVKGKLSYYSIFPDTEVTDSHEDMTNASIEAIEDLTVLTFWSYSSPPYVFIKKLLSILKTPASLAWQGSYGQGLLCYSIEDGEIEEQEDRIIMDFLATARSGLQTAEDNSN